MPKNPITGFRLKRVPPDPAQRDRNASTSNGCRLARRRFGITIAISTLSHSNLEKLHASEETVYLLSNRRRLDSACEPTLAIRSGRGRRDRNIDHLRHVRRQCRRWSQRYRKLGLVRDLALDIRRFRSGSQPAVPGSTAGDKAVNASPAATPPTGAPLGAASPANQAVQERSNQGTNQ